jgi:hypothetical protein
VNILKNIGKKLRGCYLGTSKEDVMKEGEYRGNYLSNSLVQYKPVCKKDYSIAITEWIITALAFCFGMNPFLFAHAAAPEVTIQEVLISEQLLPGPSVNAHGSITFGTFLADAIYTTAHGSDVGELTVAVSAGDVPPGMLGSFSYVGDPTLNDDGSIVFRGEGSLGIDSDIYPDRGIYLYVPPNKIMVVADGDTLRPENGETFAAYGFSSPISSGGRYLAFGYVDDFSHSVYQTQYKPERGTAFLARVIDLGSAVLSTPGFEWPPDFAINEKGGVAMALLSFEENIYKRSVYFAPHPGSLNLIAQDGDIVPGCGMLGVQGAPEVNISNTIIFQGVCNNWEKYGIFVRYGNGPLTQVVDTTTEVPNHPSVTFSGFRENYVADDGTIFFHGFFGLPEGLSSEGLYFK